MKQAAQLLQRDCAAGWVSFESLKWRLGATYDVHLRLTGKRVVDFLLVLIELFSLGVTAEMLQTNID